MSKLIVEVCTIDDVRPHTNADALELCVVKGWQCVTQKGLRKKGDKIVYVPADTLMPVELSDKMGITKYLSKGRVRCAKLRGEPSFGVIMEAEPGWEVGRDVAEHFGLTKYVPPLRATAGDAETPHPLMQKYTEIENLRNFPDVFVPDEEVVLTEKLHGTNCKIGMIEGEWMAGSMEVRRKRPEEDKLAGSIYWMPYLIEGVRTFVENAAAAGAKQVLVFGEVYGKVQNLSYDKPGSLGFAAFDILIDGKYLGYPEFKRMCRVHGIPTVPEIAVGPFALEFVRGFSGGNTTIAGATHIREGVVVRPLHERTHPKVGRVIMKYISDQYLLKKEDGKVTDTAES